MLKFISEIGINHNGDLSIAKKLMDMSKECGVKLVKFQKRTVDLVYSKEDLDKFRDSPWGTTNREQKYGLEFEKDEYNEIDSYAKKIGIKWFASPWDIKSLEFLDQYNLEFQKVASAMIVDKVLISEMAKRNIHTFISTGMSTIQDIDEAVNIFQKNNCSFELMHCVSTYPMKASDANLETINALRDRYKCDVGYSGHEAGLAVSFAAFSYNISSLERHITLDRSMYGSDQSASLEKQGLERLVSTYDTMQLAKGTNAIGKIIDDEKPIMQKLRGHIL